MEHIFISEPFFLTSTAAVTEPAAFASTTCTARQWNLTSYDALGRVTQVQRADGTGVSTTYAGLTTTTWDANGHASSQTVNALGEVVTSTDAVGLSLSFTYTPDGQIAKVSRDAGRGVVETSFQYDTLGRKISQTDRDTGTTSFACNALGELVQQTDAMNQRVERWLDARGRLWRQRAYKGTSLESTSQFVYDTLKRGLPSSDSISGSTGSQSRSYGYDALARPIRRDSTMNGRTYREQTQGLFIPGLITISNQHDARGNMISADSLRFYAYSALNQATEVHRVADYGSSTVAIRARFAYGPDGARYRRIDDGSQAGGTTTTTIIGVVERVQKPSGAIQWRRMIGGVAIVSYSADQVIGGITQAADAGTVRHQFTDRLGSVQVIGSISGASVTVHAWLRPQ